MTDIEQLRQDVIDAARKVVERGARWASQGTCYITDEGILLASALDALDAAERPDPWELLRRLLDLLPPCGRDVECAAMGVGRHDGNWCRQCLARRELDAALAWHDKQEAVS